MFTQCPLNTTGYNAIYLAWIAHTLLIITWAGYHGHNPLHCSSWPNCTAVERQWWAALAEAHIAGISHRGQAHEKHHPAQIN